jgi:apolipoprotein N-acyltransferase
MVTAPFAAFLASAAFEPIGLWFLAIFGFALYLRKMQTVRKPILYSFVFGLLLNAIVLYWSGKYVGLLPWLLLAFLMSLFYLPVGWMFKKSKSIWLSALTLLFMEELRSRFPFGGFGWTRIAFSQVDSPALPIVSVGGVIALSAFTILVSTFLTKLNLKNLAFLFLIFVAANFLPNNPEGSGSVKLLAIQGNTPEVGLGFNSRPKAVFDLHIKATQEFAKGNYDAIVWPENAIDIDPNDNPEIAREITSLNRSLKAPLIAGVVTRSGGNPQNASILYSELGVAESIYLKRGLTPFGEYIPIRAIAEFVSPLAKTVTDFIPGNGRVTHKISGSKIGPIICYEIIDDELVRDMAKNSQALIVQNNNATFANTAQSAQQLAITRIRAVEHSRYILSVSTIGMSAFIDNNGRVLSKTLENGKSFLAGQLLMSDHITLVNRILR